MAPIEPDQPGPLLPEGDFTDSHDPIDIGVGPASGSNSGRRGQQLPRRDERATSPIRVVGALAAVIAIAAVVVGLLSGGDAERATDSPLPAPTAPPEVLDLPDPARPAPTATVQVPVVSDGLLRAGETCRIPLDDDRTNVIYTVPDGHTVRDCTTDGLLLRDPGSQPTASLGSVSFSPQTLGLNLNQLRGLDDWAEATSRWQPIDNRRGYRLQRSTDDLEASDQIDLVEVPGGTLIIASRNRNHAPDNPQMIDNLIASVRVEGPDVLPAPELPQRGGWCGTDQFVTEVPPGWFAGERCRWLNTSSESPEVLQCECLPPLWIEALDIPFDGDFGFSTIDVDRLVPRPDGSTIRIIEGLRRDANNMDRPLRVVIVDGGSKRVALVATEFPEHVLPGHTWQRTLDAQQYLLEHLRFHSQPDCDGPQQRLVVAGDGGGTRLLIADEPQGVTNGTLLATTGCTRDGDVEVRVVAAPEVIGWVDPAQLAEPQITPCPSGERDFRPHDWLSAVVGDFDGDGRSDAAYTRNNSEGGSDLAVLFANGGLAEAWGLASIDRLPEVTSFVGLGRDVLQVVEQHDRGATVSLLDASSCEVVSLVTWSLGFVDGARHQTCLVEADPFRSFRTWSESFDDRQGWVVESDLFWFSADSRMQSASVDPNAREGLCGPTLTEFAARVEPDSPGASLAGEHELTLQWIEARDESTGSIEFTPIGNDRYEVDGVHEAAFGFLSMRGVIERIDETTFAFDGTISSQIPWLNRGDPCIRRAGQRFVLHAEEPAPTFRMQDRINCDGARTDWIDIRLSE